MRLRSLALVLATVLVVALVPGCERKGGGTGDTRVGDMSDRSWGGLRGAPPRISASGEEIAMEGFAGRFVWAEYAAPWCGPCDPQAAEVRSLDDGIGSDVVFLTVMTSDQGGYGDPATRATAEAWASKHGLDPGRVVAADLTATTVPRHVLFSPEGHMLFERTGLMRATEIRDVLEARRNDWQVWKSLGEPAAWMRRAGKPRH